MKNILWIDVIKGLGILTVVAGHIYGGEISRNIYIFHMPLFFFISGHLFNPTLEYKKYFIKKVAHLLIPYFSFLILLDSKAILGFIYNLVGNSMSSDKFIFYKNHFCRIIYGGAELKGYFGVFWFITCLFITQQAFNYLTNKLKPNQLLITMLSSLIISYSNTYVFPNISLPWNANVVFGAMPIFYLGHLYRKQDFRINHILLHILGLAIILFSSYFPANVYNMKSANYGIPIITLVSSLVIILNIKYLSVKIANYKFPLLLLSEIGKASMAIMYLHQTLQFITSSHFSNDNTIRFLIATIASYIIYLVLSKFRLGKAFFLGSYADLKGIFVSLIKYRNALKLTRNNRA